MRSGSPKTSSLLRPAVLDLIAKAEEIEKEDAKTAGAVAYVGRMFVQASMPHSDPGGNEFCRKNGNYTLVMMAPTDIGLPYGSLPRLILTWISTEAVRSRDPVIVLGESLAAFMREIEITPTGGRCGSILRLKDQMQRLFSTQISCVYLISTNLPQHTLPLP